MEDHAGGSAAALDSKTNSSENTRAESTYTRRGELKFDGKSDTLLDFRDHVQRKAEIEGGATMKLIALGELGSIDPANITPDEVEARFTVALPARGRSVLRPPPP